MEQDPVKTTPTSRPVLFWRELIRAAEGLVALLILWDGFAIVGGHLIRSLDGNVPGGWSPVLMSSEREPGTIYCSDLGAFEPYCNFLVICIVTVVVVAVVLKWVCERKWVQEERSYEDCWKEKDWYNPWHWVEVLVCAVVTTLWWVLKVVCYLRKVLIWGLVVACVLAVIVAVA